MSKKTKSKKVLVGMSGGVDSAVSAFFCLKKGYETKGVFFILSKESKKHYKRVKKIADILGIDLIKKDLSVEFKKKIINNFIKEYKKGKTPNPCIICNAEIKFNFLEKLAKEEKADYIATGHYARIKKKKGAFSIRKAKDLKKDQSYFLYRLKSGTLKDTIFPLGNFKKRDILEMVKTGLFKKIQFEKESQDVCFFSKDEKFRQYLKKFINEKKGKILDEDSKQLGWHKGVWFYTKGQRKGLNLPGGPFYVTGKDKKNNILFVSKKKNGKLLSSEIFFENTFWTNKKPKEEKSYQIKIRYAAKPVDAFLEREGKNRWKARIKGKIWAVTSGQSLVVYNKDEVIGGGIIK